MDVRLSTCHDEDVTAALEALDVSPQIVSASEWPGDLSGREYPGLYSWWVDDAGARDEEVVP